MQSKTPETQESKHLAAATRASKQAEGASSLFTFEDNRPEALAQKKQIAAINASPHLQQQRAFQAPIGSPASPIQQKETPGEKEEQATKESPEGNYQSADGISLPPPEFSNNNTATSNTIQQRTMPPPSFLSQNNTSHKATVQREIPRFTFKSTPTPSPDLRGDLPPFQIKRNLAESTAQKKEEPPIKPNNTGLPDNLKTGMENLSGMSLDDVKVHYNSKKPAQLQAHAYAQGTDIHVASGQERHLPHEAWHVVQQKQRRVKPTMQMNGDVNVNDDAGLEKEADVMGTKAVQMQASSDQFTTHNHCKPTLVAGHLPQRTVQRTIEVASVDFDLDGPINENGFYNAVSAAINGDDNLYSGHKNVRAQVIENVKKNNYSNPDIPSLSNAILLDFQTEYGNTGNPIAGGTLQRIKDHIETALVANIQSIGKDMDAGERGQFDALANSAGVVLSRGKSQPSTIPHANLPGPIAAVVNAVLTEIRNERARWNVGTITPPMILSDAGWAGKINKRQKDEFSYQGNHNSSAGWLPHSNTPVDQVSALWNQVYRQASSGLRTRLLKANPSTKLGLIGAGVGQKNSSRSEFLVLAPVAIAGLGNAAIKLSSMAALCNGVSAFIEFNMAHSISRLVYDPVQDRVYITAHYKWRNGYNPFFEVLGFPAV